MRVLVVDDQRVVREGLATIVGSLPGDGGRRPGRQR